MHVLIAALHRPTKPTGVCRYAANLARCLAARDEVTRVTLVVGAWQQQYFRTALCLTGLKIHLESIPIQNRSLFRNRWYLFGLPKLAGALRPDIVHLSFPIPFFHPLFKVPVVATIHDLYPYEYPENFGYPRVLFNQLFLQLCIRNSNALACVSNSTLNILKHYLPKSCDRKATAIVYNYVDFNQVEPQQPNFIKQDQSSEFLLCVGQHRKNKNLDLLIQAFGALKQGKRLSPVTKLVIIGSPGPETDRLMALVNQLMLQEQVLLASAIDDSELSWLYQNCQLFVIASSTEGFCIPLAEALYFSAKVVCSNIPVFKEIGSDRCIYFDLQGDICKNLAQSIDYSLNEIPEDRNYKDHRFSGKNTAQACLSLYSELINLNL